MENYLLFFTTKVLGINGRMWCLGLSYLRRVCLFNAHKTPSLKLRHGLGSLHQPPASPCNRGTDGDRQWLRQGLWASSEHQPRPPVCLLSWQGQDGVEAGGLGGSPACRASKFVAFPKGWRLVPPVGHCCAFLSGSFAQEGGRPCGSFIRDAP